MNISGFIQQIETLPLFSVLVYVVYLEHETNQPSIISKFHYSPALSGMAEANCIIRS